MALKDRYLAEEELIKLRYRYDFAVDDRPARVEDKSLR
jgi:hypothetical protein